MIIDRWSETHDCPSCETSNLECQFVNDFDKGHAKDMGGDKPDEYDIYCEEAVCAHCDHEADPDSIESRRYA